jgi:hypothetical protein
MFPSKNIGLSQPVPLSQRWVSADQRQEIFPSPRLRAISDGAVLRPNQPEFHALDERGGFQ